MSDFIFEIYSEEIPARLQKESIAKLVSMIKQKLQQYDLHFGKIKEFVTPRRMAVMIEDLQEFTAEKKIEVKGPQISAPKMAIEGFLKSNSADISDLEVKTIKNKQFYFYIKNEVAIATANILTEILPEIIHNFSWQRSQKWDHTGLRWIRPIRNILAMYAGNILDVQIGKLKANNLLHGHFFMRNDPEILSSAIKYEEQLMQLDVIANFNLRKKIILEQVDELLDQYSLQAILEDSLIDEITGLVEYPEVLIGEFDDKYLDLPQEVLINYMKHHQKYIPLFNNNILVNKFLVVANVKTNNNKFIIQGNERILAARFEDATFFWQHDLKEKLINKYEMLDQVTFHTKLGSMKDKVNRIYNNAIYIADNYFNYSDEEVILKTVKLIKADLVTDMVREFPDLQGVIGSYYANEQGEAKEIANAIKDHYQPITQNHQVPDDKLSQILALSDKLDSVVGLWCAGEKPTGSRDAFALRRTTLSIISIIVEKELLININELLQVIFNNYNGLEDQNIKAISEFFRIRFDNFLKNKQISYDIIDALDKDSDNYYIMYLKACALSNLKKQDICANIINIYNRVNNILASCDQDDIDSIHKIAIDPSLFASAEEKTLYKNYKCLSEKFGKHIISNQFDKAFYILDQLSEPLDAFFNNVMVNDENIDIRKNRIILLSDIKTLFCHLADFSTIKLQEQV